MHRLVSTLDEPVFEANRIEMLQSQSMPPTGRAMKPSTLAAMKTEHFMEVSANSPFPQPELSRLVHRVAGLFEGQDDLPAMV